MVRTRRPTVALVLSLAAPAVGTWVSLWMPTAQPWPPQAYLLLRWLPALLVAAAGTAVRSRTRNRAR
ncbi:MAG TPA: hypothetical protein VK060_13180 [Ruania sp.]|nr:hypothetical protein [Ruania sp.]